MTITKTKLIESIWKKSELPKQESISTLESLIEIIKKTLESGEDLLISGFGKFTVKDKKKRKGRNPQTGKEIDIPARNVPKFVPGKALKDAIK